MGMDAMLMTAWAGVVRAGSGVGIPASIGGSVAPLPRAPAWEVMVLESPLLGAIALVVVGCSLWWTLRASGRGRVGVVAAASAMVLAGVLMVTAAVVETAREAMSRRTRDLVRAAVTGDGVVMREILAEDARVRAGERFRWVGRIEASGREEIASRVEREVSGALRPEGWGVLKLQAKRDGGNVGRTQVQVRVDAGGPLFSWWRLDWRLEEDGAWRVMGIEPLFVGGVGG